MQADDPLDILEPVDGHAVDLDDHVPRLESGLLGGAVRLYGPDIRRREGLADDTEQPGENDYGEKEVGERSGTDDGRAVSQRLVLERHAALFFGQFAPGPVRLVIDLPLAEHLDVAAKRNGAELPARARPVVPAEEFRTEADGEDLDPDTATPRDVVVTEFVHEHEDGQDEQEWDNVIPQPAKQIHIPRSSR